ncbi:MAG: SDR family oxidoreductase [Bacteriovoracaceae bacterium]|nr:SDR family oxidoreductase [Bacteriovoracaceae bacterium]
MKTVWITGASSGIGEALAIEYAKAGHRVIVSARSTEKLEKLKSKYQQNIIVIPLDLSEYSDFKALVQEAIDRVGKVDILINNGGISQRSYAKDTSIDVLKKIFEVNVFGTIALTNEILPFMLKERAGSIVTISSLVGKFGTPLRSSYSASKHALHGYFDSLRAELPEQINVLMCCPGFVKTNVSVNALVGDGSVQGKMDNAQNNAMSAQDFAKKLISKIEAKKSEVYIGGKEVFGVYLKRYLPSIFEKIIRKAKVN